MATDFTKKRNIKYLNKDFNGFKQDLIEHLKVYFPDYNADFNEGSVGMMLAEMCAFIGDNMSYYLDKKFQESFIETATERKNVMKHARQLGFKPFGKIPAVGSVDATIEVPVITSEGGFKPDMAYAGKVKRGAKIRGGNGKIYETLIDIDFSGSESTAVVGKTNSSTKDPISFVLTKSNIDIKAGETKSQTITVGTYEAFRKITLTDDDITDIVEVKDSEGNEWYGVDYLAQDTVFVGEANTSANLGLVPNVLKLKSVPYRFISEYDIETGKTSLIFGPGDTQTFDGDLIPDLAEIALPLYGREYFTDFAIDPQNFLKTRTLGLAPINTSLTVKYRTGGGLDTNAGSNTLSTVISKTFTVGNTSLNQATVNDVSNTFAVNNSKPINGGLDEKPLEELKQLISANFAAQNRMVTEDDFTIRALSMPSEYGSVFRARSMLDPFNKSKINIHVLTKNAAGNVVASTEDLRNNLKTYLGRFRMATDSIDILNGEIINIKLSFKVLTKEEYNTDEVLSDCIVSLRDYFNVDKWQINQPINITSIYRIISDVPGVLSVVDLKFKNIVGTADDGRAYSTTTHNMEENTKNGIIYCSDMGMFEVLNPDKDIVGSAI